jgi:hypothetical protein
MTTSDDVPFAPMDRLGEALGEALATSDMQGLSYLAKLCEVYGVAASAQFNRSLALSDQALSEKGAPILERWLTPAEAADMLRISTKSLSRRWRELPFCRPSATNRGFRASLTGLRAYMSGGKQERGRSYGRR